MRKLVCNYPECLSLVVKNSRIIWNCAETKIKNPGQGRRCEERMRQLKEWNEMKKTNDIDTRN